MANQHLKSILITGAILIVAPILVLADEVQDGRAIQLRQEAKQKREVLMQEFKARRETFKAEA